MLGGSRAEQEDRPLAGLGTDLQSANLFRSGLRKPGDQRAAAVALDQLFSAPQALGWCIGLHPDQVLFVNAGVSEAGKMRLLRRANDDDA